MLRLLISGRPLVLLLFAAACQSASEQAESYAQQAQALTDSGDNRGALTAAMRAVTLRDDNLNYWILLGAIQMRGGNPVEAYKAFSRALELDGANVSALTFVANVGLQIGQVTDAQRAADRLLSLDPNSTVGLQVRGLTSLFGGKQAEAAQYAAKILSLSPHDEAGTIIQARILAQSGKLQESLGLIENALSTTGPTPALLITKLNLYRALRQPDQMLATLDRLLPLVKNQSPSLLIDQINLLYKMGKTERARQAVQAFLTAGSSNSSDYRSLYRIWFEYDPKPFDRTTIKNAGKWPDPLALVMVGRYLIWQNAPQVADDLYFAIRPGLQPIGISIHIRAVLGLGHVDEARKGQGIILDRDTDDVDALLLRAYFEKLDGHQNFAIEAAQKALSSDPFDPETYVVLAGLNQSAGDKWRAGQIYEDGLKQLPQDFMLIDRYTQYLHQLGDKSRAISVARSFARAQPSSVKAWTIMAAQCQWAADAACAAEAEKGRQEAQVAYKFDDPPGTPANRGLLSQF